MMGVNFFVNAILHARSNELAVRIVAKRLHHLSDYDYRLCIVALRKREK